MTGKDKDEIIQIITECFESQNKKIEQVQARQSNIDKLQRLFDELVSLWKFVTENPNYKLEQYTIIESLSRHALNMVELDKYITQQTTELPNTEIPKGDEQ